MALRLHFAEEALDAAVVEQLAGLWSEAVVGQDEGETKETWPIHQVRPANDKSLLWRAAYLLVRRNMRKSHSRREQNRSRMAVKGGGCISGAGIWAMATGMSEHLAEVIPNQ